MAASASLSVTPAGPVVGPLPPWCSWGIQSSQLVEGANSGRESLGGAPSLMHILEMDKRHAWDLYTKNSRATLSKMPVVRRADLH